MKIAIIIYGPPGSGKGTQAKLIADKLDLFHLDTGRYLRQLLYDPRWRKNKTIQRERRLNEIGKLNTPAWVLKIVSQKVQKIVALGQGVIFSGSPRTLFETFGDNKNIGLIKILERFYGKKNIFVFILNILPKESIKRNISRLFCSVCQTPIMGWAKNKIKKCPFCDGQLRQRKDDNKEIILARLKEYQERTESILKKLKEKGYRTKQISGVPLPYKIHRKIVKLLNY